MSLSIFCLYWTFNKRQQRQRKYKSGCLRRRRCIKTVDKQCNDSNNKSFCTTYFQFFFIPLNQQKRPPKDPVRGNASTKLEGSYSHVVATLLNGRHFLPGLNCPDWTDLRQFRLQNNVQKRWHETIAIYLFLVIKRLKGFFPRGYCIT